MGCEIDYDLGRTFLEKGLPESRVAEIDRIRLEIGSKWQACLASAAPYQLGQTILIGIQHYQFRRLKTSKVFTNE